MASGGSTVHVAVYDLNQTLIKDLYTVEHPPKGTSDLLFLLSLSHSFTLNLVCLDIFPVTVTFLPPDYEVPAYKVTPDILSKHFIVDVEEGKYVHMRLCREMYVVCTNITSQKVRVLGS